MSKHPLAIVFASILPGVDREELLRLVEKFVDCGRARVFQRMVNESDPYFWECVLRNEQTMAKHIYNLKGFGKECRPFCNGSCCTTKVRSEILLKALEYAFIDSQFLKPLSVKLTKEALEIGVEINVDRPLKGLCDPQNGQDKVDVLSKLNLIYDFPIRFVIEEYGNSLKR